MSLIISGIFILFPVLSLPLILCGLLVDKKNEKIYLICFIIWVVILLYYLIPDNDMDLYRYYSYIKSISSYNFIDYFAEQLNKPEILSNLLFFIISKTDTPQYLMVFTTVVSYSIIFYILFDYMKKKNLGNTERMIMIIYALSTFLIMYNISGVRFCLARLIFMLGIYLEFFKNKKGIKIIFLYTIPILIHSSAIIFLLIRIYMYIFKDKVKLKNLIIIMIISLIPNYIVKFLSYFGNVSFLSSLGARAEIYLSGHYSGISNIYMLQIALVLWCLFEIILIKILKIESNEKFINFSLIISLISILYLNNSSIATRFVLFTTTNSLIFNQDLLKNLNKKNKSMLVFILMLFSVVYFVYQMISIRDVIGFGKLFNENILFNIFDIFLRK